MMKVCPQCLEKYTDPVDQFCTNDGRRLVLEIDYESDELIGRSVGQRFDVVGIIGSGGMGTVYRAIQSSVDRVVALKVLKDELTDDRVAVGRFRREAKAASLLSNPHTVTLYEAGEDDDGTLFLAMELLVGKSLASRLRNREPIDWRESVELMMQVCESLAEAHEKGIVHRDLKPENIFLTIDKSAGAKPGKPTVKVLDFGIATLSRPERNVEIGLTRTGVIVGTPGYMSPEQAKGLKADARSDIYALGILLYEMITGYPPFESNEAVLLMGQHISAAPPRFESKLPKTRIPIEVEYVTMKMLAKKPEDRFQSARELHLALSQLLDETLVVPRSELKKLQSRGTPQSLFTKKQLLQFAGIAVVAFVSAVILGFSFGWRDRQTEPSRTEERLDRSTIAAGFTQPSNSENNSDEKTVTIEVVAQPEKAIILLDGEPVGKNPWRTKRERSDKVSILSIKADGFVSQTVNLSFDRSQKLVVALAPAQKGTGPSRTASKRAPRGRRTDLPQHNAQQRAKTQESSAPGPRPAKKKGTNLQLDTTFPGM